MANNKQIICIVCPLGCRMEVGLEGDKVIEVAGNQCKKGEKHAQQEVLFPGRVLTTTVKTKDPAAPLLPVRSDKPIPKGKLEESMEVMARHTVSYPIQLGDVIVSNILNTGVNIIASRSMSKKS
jgi:CxxC motif-containing protein